MGHTIKLEYATISSVKPTQISVSEDSFAFTSGDTSGATADGDSRHDTWIPILSTGGGGATEEVVKEAGLRSDGELVQAVSEDGHLLSDDFLF